MYFWTSKSIFFIFGAPNSQFLEFFAKFWCVLFVIVVPSAWLDSIRRKCIRKFFIDHFRCIFGLQNRYFSFLVHQMVNLWNFLPNVGSWTWEFHREYNAYLFFCFTCPQNALRWQPCFYSLYFDALYKIYKIWKIKINLFFAYSLIVM